MSLPVNIRRGRPLTTLIILLGGWMLIRSVTWQPPFLTELPVAFADAEDAASRALPNAGNRAGEAFVPRSSRGKVSTPEFPQRVPTSKPWSVVRIPVPAITAQSAESKSNHQPPHMAIMGHLPMPITAATAIEGQGASRLSNLVDADRIAAPAVASHLRADLWAFFRPGSGLTTPIAGDIPTYGGSQVGGVWSYTFNPEGAHRIAAYARATKALSGAREADGALGISGRPAAHIPVTAYAEVRVTRTEGRTLIRPQAFVTAQLPPQNLPFGAQVNAYGQAGYVGGEFATAFADGQIIADREVAAFDLAKVRIGVGAWGGAQRGVARVDAGPRISVNVRIAEAPVQLSLDYRTRIAGNAAPSTGAAITLSTGF